MPNTNAGPAVSSFVNEVPLRGTFDTNGKLIQILGSGQNIAFDPANVAITGGTVNGASLQGSVPFNPASVAITGGVIGGASALTVGRTTQSNLIPFGDSITGNGTSNSPAVPDGLYGKAWYAIASALSGGCYEIPYVAGYAGFTTTQLDANIQNDVIARAPSACTIMAGTNDPDGTSATTISTLKSWYAKCFAAGIYVYAISILPRPAASTQKKLDIVVVNSAIADYFRVNVVYGEFVDAFSKIVDPTSTTQAVIANALYDNTHPSSYGAQLIGQLLSTRFTAKGVPPYPLVSSAYEDVFVNAGVNQLAGNPLAFTPVAASGTGVSGNIPTGWGVVATNCTVVCSLVARADGLGNDAVMTITSSGTTPKLQLYSSNGLVAPTVGKKLRYAAAVSVDASPVGLTGVSLATVTGNPGGGSFGGLNGTDVGGLIGSTYIAVGPLSSAFVTGPVYLLLTATFATGTGSAVVRLGRVSARQY